MIYAVFFEDDSCHADKRTKYMPDHLSFLERHASSVQAAGPLVEAQTGASAGGLWLVTAKSREAVTSLVKEDPFWPTGLRKSVRILEWRQVFADGKRQV